MDIPCIFDTDLKSGGTTDDLMGGREVPAMFKEILYVYRSHRVAAQFAEFG